ncbi:MAG: hypothetical protein A2V65_12410 [Deltaproteobacteria bacterium RBG_13_49_15]|nr:MAG: hypothetical protein A2V65_12410 [Deltaproteobacteria bacterium RBG_13_49_15]
METVKGLIFLYYNTANPYCNRSCCCKSRGRPRSKASKGEAVVFYCESLATKEMGHHRLSLRVKNMTNFLFVL